MSGQVLAIFGSFISYIYSAPPLKLKQSGWAGNYALGSSYIALPWWAGQVRHNTSHTSLAYHTSLMYHTSHTATSHTASHFTLRHVPSSGIGVRLLSCERASHASQDNLEISLRASFHYRPQNLVNDHLNISQQEAAL